jgi:predicted DNA-binding transcriptional regulator AlpA
MALNFVPRHKAELLTKKEAADLLRTTPRTLDRWHRHGQGPRRITIGKRVRYLLKDVWDWVDRRPFASQPETTLELIS